MAPARAGDPARADLAALRDEAPQHRDVLVVDLVDLVPAVRAGLPTRGGLCALPVAPANRPSTLLCHSESPAHLLSISLPQNGMSSSDTPAATGVSKSLVSAGMSL